MKCNNLNNNDYYKLLFVVFFLCSFCLSSNVVAAEDSVVEIHNWTELRNAAGDPTITNMRLEYNVSSGNTCSVPWTVTDQNRILDLNGHSITSTGGSGGDCAMYISYNTGWNNYSMTIKNGKLAQSFTKNSSSSLVYANKSGSTASNYNLILQNVDMEMSPSVLVGSAIRFERATNTNHSRRLEIDGGKYNIVGSGAIHFQTYTSSNGNTEYSSRDRVILKKMQIKNISSATGYAIIFGSHINKPLSSIIHSDSELYDGEILVSDLSPVNYSSRNTLTIRPKRTMLPNLAVSLDDWVYGGAPNRPVVTGNLEAGLETFSYRLKGTEDWSFDIPSEVGEYELRVNVAQTENYLASEATTEFKIESLPPEDDEETSDDSAENEPPASGSSAEIKEPNSPNTGNFTDGENNNSSMIAAFSCIATGIIVALALYRVTSRK